METIKKKVQAVMLPTEDKTNIVIDNCSNNLFYTSTNVEKYPNLTNQHLYFISDEEIKNGDYVYSVLYGIGQVIRDYKGKATSKRRPLVVKFNNSETLQSYSRDGIWQIGESQNVAANNCKKIIATTDKLVIGRKHDDTVPYPKMKNVYLPHPTTDFIKAYCKQSGIDEVLVEYNVFEEIDDNPKYTEYSLKVNKYNEITTYPIKTSWSREEVEKLICKGFNDFRQKGKSEQYFPTIGNPNSTGTKKKYIIKDVNNWIKENL